MIVEDHRGALTSAHARDTAVEQGYRRIVDDSGGLQTLILVSSSRTPCGVEAFARRLSQVPGPIRFAPHVLDGNINKLRHRLRSCTGILLNLPVVAWKRKLWEPVAAASIARASRKRVDLILHEWSDLDWKRRAAFVPLLPAATTILFSSPEVRDQFEKSPSAKLSNAARRVIPIPPNLERPAGMTKIVAPPSAGGNPLLTVGHFGSIYPRKQSLFVLDALAALQAKGLHIRGLFIGSFVKGSDHFEDRFWARVDQLGLRGKVTVTGYVATEADVFALFDQVDVFVYVFDGGLSSRRGSVLASASSGRPVVVNAPGAASAFDHHPTYLELLRSCQLKFVRTQCSAEDLAEAAAQAWSERSREAPVDAVAAWRNAAAVLADAVRQPRRQ